MSNGYFQFKQFRIAQDRCAMKVGTDGVLLGAWASTGAAGAAAQPPRAALRQPDAGVQQPPLDILDVGTGTGLLALMLAQRAASREWGHRAFSVVAVEREAAAASQARGNVAASPWAAEITVVEADARDWALEGLDAAPAQPADPADPAGAPRFDLIVCNPPFYANYLKSPDAARNAARHDDGLSLHDLFRLAAARLKPFPATLSLILPADREQVAVETAARYGLRPVRQCHVFTTPAAACPSRVLLAFGALPANPASDCPAAPSQETLRIYSSELPAGTQHPSTRYSPEYRALVSPFYLNL